MATTDPCKQDQVKVYIVDHTTTNKERRELNDLFSAIGTPYEPGIKFVPPMRVELKVVLHVRKRKKVGSFDDKTGPF